jgi:hypothetical protein
MTGSPRLIADIARLWSITSTIILHEPLEVPRLPQNRHQLPFQGFPKRTKTGNETMYTLEFQLSYVPKHLHHPVISVALGKRSNKHLQRLQLLTTLSYIPRCGEEPVPATLRLLFAGFNNSQHQDAKHACADVAEEADPSLLFQQAGSAEERRTVVTVALRAKVARALGVTVEVDAEKMFAECT